MKYFITSDIHSYFDEWQKALNDAGYDRDNNEHILVVLGDLLDRGPQSIECLKFVNSIPAEGKILIKGNHEELMQDIFRVNFFRVFDYHNGTVDTFRQISGIQEITGDNRTAVIDIVRNNADIKEYLSCLKDYYEDNESIFVHGWIPCHCQEFFGDYSDYSYDPDWRTSKKWKDARWYNGMDAWHDGVVEEGKTIYCGHFHCSYGNAYFHDDGLEFLDDIDEKINEGIYENFNPFIDEGICAIDACTAYTGKVNCVVVEADI